MSPDDAEAALQKEYRRVAARERRRDRAFAKQERAWHAEIDALMKTGLSFDDAWIAAGGIILETNLSHSKAAP